LKASLSRLVERALAGEEIVIARNGQPLVRLDPVPTPPKPKGDVEAVSEPSGGPAAADE
jgi:antitoxin (DNA-binding transcriptional repressor) of toxin-antitoxin stability system